MCSTAWYSHFVDANVSPKLLSAKHLLQLALKRNQSRQAIRILLSSLGLPLCEFIILYQILRLVSALFLSIFICRFSKIRKIFSKTIYNLPKYVTNSHPTFAPLVLPSINMHRVQSSILSMLQAHSIQVRSLLVCGCYGCDKCPCGRSTATRYCGSTRKVCPVYMDWYSATC